MGYMRTARAKGLAGRSVVLSHGLRNAAIPIITLIGGHIPRRCSSVRSSWSRFSVSTVSGSSSSSQRSRPAVVQFLVFYAIVVVSMNLLIDLSYALIDPRVKYA